MKFRTLGNASVSIVGQGTWNMEGDDSAQAVRALKRGLDLGMNHIDTAEMYGDGKVERLVARAIDGRRGDAFLVSKVMPGNASYRGTLQACEASLKRLGTDYLDLYLLHWPGNHPLEETMRAFDELAEAGKIRAYGVSNFDVPGLEEAVRLAGPNRIACNQVLYHLQERTVERQVMPWCEEYGVAVVGYSPFGSGRFALRGERAKVLGEVASSRGASPRQVTLAFLTRRESLFAIPKSSNHDHVEENHQASEIELSQAELEQLEKAFPVGRRQSGVPTL
ncbi:MAG: aldo/keto reductase [Vicinamibacteria bacterium]